MSGCIAQRLEVARATQYVAPKRSRFSKAVGFKVSPTLSAWRRPLAKRRR